MKYVHTRAGGWRRWICVDRVGTEKEAERSIQRLRAQDDPMWATAEYLISDSLNPRPEEDGKVYTS